MPDNREPVVPREMLVLDVAGREPAYEVTKLVGQMDVNPSDSLYAVRGEPVPPSKLSVTVIAVYHKVAGGPYRNRDNKPAWAYSFHEIRVGGIGMEEL